MLDSISDKIDFISGKASKDARLINIMEPYKSKSNKMMFENTNTSNLYAISKLDSSVEPDFYLYYPHETISNALDAIDDGVKLASDKFVSPLSINKGTKVSITTESVKEMQKRSLNERLRDELGSIMGR
jgi:hypothetical protein